MNLNLPIGTLINMLAVITGGFAGLFLNKKLTNRVQEIIFQALGLCTLVIGVQMSLQTNNFLLLIFSVVIGGVLGESLNLKSKIKNISNLIKAKFAPNNDKFSEGLISAFVIFCTGSMTIIGSLNEGISGDRSLLITKSVLDGLTAIVLASTYGVGVLFSVVPMLIFQGGLTLFASRFSGVFSELLLTELTAIGGVLILGISLNLLKIKEVRVVNLLPGLAVGVLINVL
jgi:uncharacterized membrane protein YqgA involved in biofilm formation